MIANKRKGPVTASVPKTVLQSMAYGKSKRAFAARYVPCPIPAAPTTTNTSAPLPMTVLSRMIVLREGRVTSGIIKHASAATSPTIGGGARIMLRAMPTANPATGTHHERALVQHVAGSRIAGCVLTEIALHSGQTNRPSPGRCCGGHAARNDQRAPLVSASRLSRLGGSVGRTRHFMWAIFERPQRATCQEDGGSQKAAW